MRTMMTIKISTEAVNKAARDGTMKPALQKALEMLKPEATYFYPAEDGRTILLFVDVKESSDMPGFAEPFFAAFDARVAFTPVMNLQDFQAGQAKK